MPFGRIICCWRQRVLNFEKCVWDVLFGKGFPPGLHALPVLDAPHPKLGQEPSGSPDLLGFLKSPFLFAVPKHRRTIEKRRNRKFGWPQWVWKPLVPKTNILMCDTCGHDYQAGHLCGYCYKQIQKETEEMQKAIQAELQLSPIEEEVVVLYQGEAQGKSEEFWKGKRIVEMKKPRPAWFSANLLQKTSRDNLPDEKDKNVKPSDLA